MTLPSIGTTAGAQAANISVAATTDANGNITFVGPSGIQGSTITCVVTVPLAPAGAVFTATLGTIGGQGVAVDTWGGSATGGQFQLLVGQTLTVAGVGLSPTTQYTCTFGTITDDGAVQVVIPDPNSSAELADLASAGLAGVHLSSEIVYVATDTQETITPQIDFQYWSWGWLATSIVKVPTSGNATINFDNVATGLSLLDNLNFYEGASDRLAGANFGSDIQITFTNNFNFDVEFFVNFSISA
jgi:hypothetical protein